MASRGFETWKMARTSAAMWTAAASATELWDISSASLQPKDIGGQQEISSTSLKPNDYMGHAGAGGQPLLTISILAPSDMEVVDTH